MNDPWYGSNNSPFSTYNRDNDRSSLNCASMLKVSLFDLYYKSLMLTILCDLFPSRLGRLVVEVVRPRLERAVPARSPGSDRATGNRVVPLARMGLYPEEGHHDD